MPFSTRTIEEKLITLLSAALLLAACSVAPPLAVQAPPTVTTAPVIQATATANPTSTSSATHTYQNPIYPFDFPDPYVLPVDGSYYAYSTNSAGRNIPVIRISSDFSQVDKLGDALPTLPGWSVPNRSLTWAPAVLKRGSGYVMYYTTRDTKSNKQCISRAASKDPAGPFTDDSSKPMVCQTEMGGSIDPSPFIDEDGKAYLLWKNDGNCCGLPVLLWSQPLSEDGMSLTGEPSQLIHRDQVWEDPLIEAPAMLLHNDQYYLFYSGNWWESVDYAVGYAVCSSPSGPCKKTREQPWFISRDKVLGPGGEEFFQDSSGHLWMAYHAWTKPDVGYPNGQRSLHVDPVNFTSDVPESDGPTDTRQTLP